jgi:Peptidase family M49
MTSIEPESKMDQSFRERFRKLVLVEFDTRKLLPTGVDRSKIDHLLRAADLADEIYWRQVSPEHDRASLMAKAGDDGELKEILLFNYGPYDRLDGDAPVLAVSPKLAGLDFYPEDLTRDGMQTYLRQYPESRSRFESPYTIIRRTNSHLRAIPYHEAYKDQVRILSDILRSASEIEQDMQFRQYLLQRAKDLLTDEYYESDRLWVELEDNPLDLVIGPIEVYEDHLMGLKASYDAAVLWRDLEASSAIVHFKEEVVQLAGRLEHELAMPLRITSTGVKLSVANLVYAGGEARAATPAIAFNLPNDERVTEEVGSRQVILKNVLEAKFRSVAWPILVELIQNPSADRDTAFKAFFHHTLFHEISHSVGPHRITKAGEATTVNRSLREYYSVLEEAKADTLATCFLLTKHDDNPIIPALLETYVSGFIRPVRFGLTSAHGGANCIQFNFLMQEKAFSIDASTGRITIDQARLRSGIFKLASTIVGIQERGDFAAAKGFVITYRTINPEIETLIRRVKDVPIDIRIRYIGEK